MTEIQIILSQKLYCHKSGGVVVKCKGKVQIY